MKEVLEWIGKLPEWAVKIAFVVLVLIVADMYVRSVKAFTFGDTVVGFLSKGELQSKIVWAKDDVVKQNYPNGAWAGTTKSASCPEGYVVAGVNIVYGGTCDRKCDPDGGAVRQVELMCRRLTTDAPPLKKANG